MRIIWCCLVAALTTLISSSAIAADEVGLSNDGTTWGSTLAHPLFDPSIRWVPGDDETASFYVRNQGPTRALMTIEARSADTDELLSNDDIALKARAAGGAWVDLENGVPTADLAGGSIASGGVVKVDVNAVFDWQSPNRSQSKTLPLTFRVTLTDSLEDVPGGGSEDEALPGTGSSFTVWQVVMAGLLIGFGIALLRRRGAGRSKTGRSKTGRSETGRSETGEVPRG